MTTQRTLREIATAQVEHDVHGQELSIIGLLGVQTVADVRQALAEAVDSGIGDLVVHLGRAEVNDATGLGVIVGAHHRARRAGRRLVIADASDRMVRLLRMSRLDRVIASPFGPARPTVGAVA